jgi:hypothetical protein
MCIKNFIQQTTEVYTLLNEVLYLRTTSER